MVMAKKASSKVARYASKPSRKSDNIKVYICRVNSVRVIFRVRARVRGHNNSHHLHIWGKPLMVLSRISGVVGQVCFQYENCNSFLFSGWF